MPKSVEDKLFRYVRDGRLRKLRTLLKTHERSDMNLNEITDRKNRTPLHIACMLGEETIAGVLLNNGASVFARDEELNTPLHLALRYALQVLENRTITELIKPLIRADRGVVDTENVFGEKPRELVKVLKEKLKLKEEDRKKYEEEEETKRMEKSRLRKEELEWKNKLFDEMQCDDSATFHDAFANDDVSGHRQESYDEWAGRILREKRAKYFATHAKLQTKDKSQEFEQQEREARARTKELEAEHEAYIKEVSERRLGKKMECLKDDYEARCNEVFNGKLDSKLLFDNIPWPCKGTAQEMLQIVSKFCDLSKDRKKGLREQQIRWHPDKFLQRCGERLDVHERDKVVEYVIELSQGINGLMENES